ncbi:DUF1829 domain-containing protein [Ciceribacter azotifigens]|uniref:DUF1829 domain-containing protein n=1 Tax=Ciceribacter azotifigens TaxID=2069303 RepID=UPI003A8A739A
MIDEVSALIDNYRKWLKDKTDIKLVGDAAEITTPFLDRHNDCIQIYARKENDGYVLSDGGYIIDDLAMSGCALDTQKRQELLKITLAGFGITNERGELKVRATAENFALRKHNLIQAMLAVNDLFYLAKPFVASIFLEDVAAWLEENDIRYVPNIKFTGKSGFDHMFDFAIPKTRTAPERLLRAINNPTKDAAQSLAFSWLDTKDVRPQDSKAFAVLNDRDRAVSSAVEEALRQYEVAPILWSKRNESLGVLIN